MDAVYQDAHSSQSLSQSDIDILEAEVIRVINDSLDKREKNDRDNITQALRSGRHLSLWRDTIDHGNWRTWVLEKTHYSRGRSDRSAVRRAQNDIQLYTRWKDRIDDLIRLGLIRDLDAPESEAVASMNDSEIYMSKSALEEFMRADVPDRALDMVIDSLEHGSVQIRQAEAIIETARRIEALPDARSRELAADLNRDYGLTNPSVIDLIPQILEQPDMVQELQTNGHFYVPGVDKQVSISEAGTTDAELTLGRYNAERSIEEEFVSQARSRSITAERQDRAANFDYNSQVEGTISQILFQLQQLPGDAIYRVTVYSRKADS